MDGTARACEECGNAQQSGVQFVHDSSEGVRVDWCPNLDCPSNTALRGLLRTGPRTYKCLACSGVVEAYLGDVLGHRRSHAAEG